jgi:hypothetical protein
MHFNRSILKSTLAFFHELGNGMNQVVKIHLVFLVFVFSLVSGNQVHALKDHPQGGEFYKTLNETFYDNDGIILSPAKMNAYGDKLEQVWREYVGPRSGITETTNSILISKYRREGYTDDKLTEKVYAHELARFIDMSIDAFKKAKRVKGADEIRSALGESLHLIYTVRLDGQRVWPRALKDYIFSQLSSWKFKKNVKADEEASNLVDPSTGRFLSPYDIQALKNKNVDLSMYNPPADSSFWRDPGVIQNLKMEDVALGKTHPMYANTHITFPEKNEFTFEDVAQSQTIPKLEVSIKSADGKKIKFKLKIGDEMHSEPTATALMMATGFPADITQYRRNVVVHLGKKKFKDLAQSWEKYYLRDSKRRTSKLESLIAKMGTNNNQEEFIVFKEAVVEARVEDAKRIGPWGYEDFTHLRDVRGLVLFQIWIANLDMKDMDNNRLLLRTNGATKNEIFRMVSDPGASFGNISANFHEKLNLYPDQLLQKATSDYVNLNFKTGAAPVIKDYLSYYDGKWASRLIAKLNRSQIEAAVNLGGWPECAKLVLVEKLIRRRNDLVRGFDLGKEFRIFNTNEMIDDKFTKECLSSPLTKTDFITDFDYSLSDVLNPMGKSFLNTLSDASTWLVGQAKTYNIQAPEIGIDVGLVADILFNVKREVEENPQPTNHMEKYLVKDTFLVGFRLGANFGVFADTELIREYTLVYPVRSVEDARYQKGFIVNILMFKDLITRQDLPEKYVLSTDHYINYRTGLRLDPQGQPIAPRIDAGIQRVHLLRSVLDHKDENNVRVFRERSNATELFLKAYVRLLILRIPVLSAVTGMGNSVGYGYEISKEEFGNNSFVNAVKDAVTNGDFATLDSKKKAFRFTNKFKNSSFDLGPVGMSYNKRRSADHIYAVKNDSNDWEKVNDQVELYTKSGVTLLWPKELREKRLRVYSNQASNGDVEYSFDSSFSIEDSNTKTAELQNIYLKNLNKASRSGHPLIPFTPSLGYSRNGLWGHTISTLNLRIYDSGLKKIMRLDADSIDEKIAAHLKIDAIALSYLYESYAYTLKYYKAKGGEQLTLRGTPNVKLLSSEQMRYLRYVQLFKFEMERLQKETTELGKIEILADALKYLFYNEPGSGINTDLVSFILNLIGEKDFYLEASVTQPPGAEVKLFEEVGMFGSEGFKKPLGTRYLMHNIEFAQDLYFMLDNWF